MRTNMNRAFAAILALALCWETQAKLTPEQVSLLRGWIDQGAKWDSEISFARQPAKNLIPRKPAIQLRAGENPIDTILQTYFRTNHIKAAKPVSDPVFARRAYLDVI